MGPPNNQPIEAPDGDAVGPSGTEPRKQLVYMSNMARRTLMAAVETGDLDHIMSTVTIIAADYAAAAQDHHTNRTIHDDLLQTLVALQKGQGNVWDRLFYEMILEIIIDHLKEEAKLMAILRETGVFCEPRHFW